MQNMKIGVKLIGGFIIVAVFAAIVPTWITLNSNPVEIIRSE